VVRVYRNGQPKGAIVFSCADTLVSRFLFVLRYILWLNESSTSGEGMLYSVTLEIEIISGDVADQSSGSKGTSDELNL
jgi:hypothetical protein